MERGDSQIKKTLETPPPQRELLYLMFLRLKFASYKKRAIKTERDNSDYYAPFNQLIPNTYMKLRIDKNESCPALNSHKEC